MSFIFLDIETLTKGMLFLKNINPVTKVFKNPSYKNSSVLFKKHKNRSFRLKLNFIHQAEYASEVLKSYLKTLYNFRKLRYFEFERVFNTYYEKYLFLLDNLNSNFYNKTILDKFNFGFGFFMSKYFLKKNHHINYNNSIININFLKKERLYTKLKYSRSPAYDIVSGGSAALLAAFLGFLISEKYGFELVDSGDFYYLFIYIVFVSFSLRPVSHMLNCSES
jgi:hypothetical protein